MKKRPVYLGYVGQMRLPQLPATNCLLVLLLACARPEALVRRAASKDFECPESAIIVETRLASVDAGAGYMRPSRAFIARGCDLTVVYAVGGEWGSTWATPCAPVTVRGRTLRTEPFAGATAANICADTITDAGAIAPE